MAVQAVAGAIGTAVADKAIQTGSAQVRNPESFLNQALKYLAIGIMILAILLGVYLVANWGFLKDNVYDIGNLGFTLGATVLNFALPGALGGVVSYLNPFRQRS